jgi:hypothetical protein
MMWEVTLGRVFVAALVAWLLVPAIFGQERAAAEVFGEQALAEPVLLDAPLYGGGLEVSGSEDGDGSIIDTSPERILLGRPERNQSILVQRGSGGNDVRLDQAGRGQSAYVYQESVGGENRLRIDQAGSKNAAIGVQVGGRNAASIQQGGIDNVTLATQIGFGNSLVHVQNGVGLGLAVTQSGGSSISVTQTGFD